MHKNLIACSVHLNARKFLSNLVPQCLRASWKSAFTLAETLIVIGIIGVVAALTLPNLNHATGDKEKVTKVKKIYSALTDAFDRAEAIYGPYEDWFIDKNPKVESLDNAKKLNKKFAQRIIEFMKISKDCGFGEGCFSDSPFIILSKNPYSRENYLAFLEAGGTYMVMTTDGMSLAFNDCDNALDCKIRVDIDGPNKGKNQEGNDIFYFNVCYRGACINNSSFSAELLPEGHSVKNYLDHPSVSLSPFHNFTAWVIEHGNLDYLKCPEELNWETQTSCK